MFGMMFKMHIENLPGNPLPKCLISRNPTGLTLFGHTLIFFGCWIFFFLCFYDFQSFSFDKNSKKIAYLPNLKNIGTFSDTIPFFLP